MDNYRAVRLGTDMGQYIINDKHDCGMYTALTLGTVRG